MRLFVSATALLLLQQPPATSTGPLALVRGTLAVVEGDSVAAFSARWSRALRRDANDRTALLALGSLARLTYDYLAADSLLPRVTALRDGDAVADYARIELGASLAARGRFRQADSVYAAALAGALRRADSTAVGQALLGLAVPRSRLAAPGTVLPLLERAERLLQGDPRGTANARCQRATLLSRTGSPEAPGLAASGAALARRAGDRRQEARCIQVTAQNLAARGDLNGAAAALDRAAPLYRATRDLAQLASLLQWRGYLDNGFGRYGEARISLTAAVEAGEQAQAMSPVGWALINLGMISLGMGDRVSATEELDRALALLEGQGDQWGAATARGMLGGVARAAGDTAAARAAYAGVLAWAEGSGDALTQLNMHSALASIAEMQRDWAGATREYEAARGIARARHMTGWERSLRYNFGRVALGRGDYIAAERQLRLALAGSGESEHSWRYTSRALLAEALAGRGALLEAEAELTAATDELDGWRASLSGHERRVRAMEFDQGIDPDLGVATVIAALAGAGRVASAFQLAERRRAHELVDRIDRAAAALPDALAVTGAGPMSAGGAADVSALLPDDVTALVEYVTGRGGEPTTIFIATRTGVVARAAPPIDSLAADLRRLNTLLEADGDARALGARLGAVVLGPALEGLDPRVQRLIVVPDDILARLPFDALVLDDGRYAVERFAISIAPSAGTVAALRARPTRARPVRLLAFGDPTFTPRPGSDGTDENPATGTYRAAFDNVGGLPRLSRSGREARRAARFAPDAVVLLRRDASEASLRATTLGAFGVLHFATHALVDENAVSRTALALAPGGGEDGFLGPADLAALRLDADLVVLSACRTAGGTILRGEGIQGLSAPLLQAGARSIVATAWQIGDANTARVVDALYRGLASGRTVSDALRDAKLEAMRAGARPSEWAAFVALGDPMTTVQLVEPEGPAVPRGWIGIAGTLALVALLGYGVMRKRSGGAVS